METLSIRRNVNGDKKTMDSYGCPTCDRSALLRDLLEQGSRSPPDCLSPYQPPPWFDSLKFKRGQVWFRQNFLCVIVSNLIGLLCLLSCETILRVLVFTRRSSSISAAFKRYLHTINHIRLWYSQDIFDQSTKASASLQTVRRMHTHSHADAKKSQVASTSQTDMVVTQWAFFGLILTHNEYIGVRSTKEDEEALIHFWKTIGYLMGIEDKYNLAFGSLDEVRQNCHAVVHQIIVPNMKNPPEGCSSMSDALLDGVHLIVPAVDPAAFMNYTKRVLGLSTNEQDFSLYSRFIFNLMVWNFSSGLHIPVVGNFLRWLENELLNFALFICNNFSVIHPKYTSFRETLIAVWEWSMRCIVNFIKNIFGVFRVRSS